MSKTLFMVRRFRDNYRIDIYTRDFYKAGVKRTILDYFLNLDYNFTAAVAASLGN